MAGPMTIQRAPKGVLDLLSMKGTGELPHELSSTLVASINLTDLYQQEVWGALRAATAAVGANGFFGVTAHTVPDGEFWLIRSVSATTSNMAAGETYRVNLALSRAGVGNVLVLSPTVGAATGVTQRVAVGWWSDPPLVARPGDVVGIYATDVVAGAHAFSVDLEKYRVLI